MKKDFDFLEELQGFAKPREKTSFEKALELAEQLKFKLDKVGPAKNTPV